MCSSDLWIPLEIDIDAAVSDEGAEQLSEICPGADISVIETFAPDRGGLPSRGIPRSVTKRINLHYVPQPDKQSVYADSVRDLLIDQVSYILDPTHRREIDESNGRNAVAMAQRACILSGSSQ